ncbi:response regulator [Teredinibacter waterburyi]|uniref:response regulator n=1 Tax=Teredinibacter waterburyi TaxID=1500538 RepID=UPI00165F8840|nr:response regulator [Teredinibacter waterburyi]
MSRVLIVDDSKTAQFRLKKMLARFDLDVDTALSAEEALGYLSYQMPSVIFMDHHMEGMDGLEALKIIKANPSTAMIPVIMYTAEQGDVYTGQARALGALDILSKEVIKPSNLERVLSSLGIKPLGREPIADVAPPEPEDTFTTPQVAAPADFSNVDRDPPLSQVRAQVARLFEMHIADVRQQISENSRFIISRISREIDEKSHQEATVGDVPLSVLNAEIEADQKRSATISGALLILIFIALGLIGYELMNTRSDLKNMGENVMLLAETNIENQALVASLSEALLQERGAASSNISEQLLDILSWALDTDFQFNYGEAPLNETTVGELSNLIYRLAEVGYSGTVELNIHFGNSCLQLDDSGNWQLADAELTADGCTMQSEINADISSNDYLSLPYLNFEQTATPIKTGQIELQIRSSGFGSPRYNYPLVTPSVTAVEWNEIATKNNRVTINLIH